MVNLPLEAPHHFQSWDSSPTFISGCGGTGSATESETKYERLDIFAANTTSPPYLWVFSLRVVYSMVGIALPLAGHLPCYFLLLLTHQCLVKISSRNCRLELGYFWQQFGIKELFCKTFEGALLIMFWWTFFYPIFYKFSFCLLDFIKIVKLFLAAVSVISFNPLLETWSCISSSWLQVYDDLVISIVFPSRHKFTLNQM